MLIRSPLVKLSAGTLSALRSDATFADSNGVTWGLNTNGVLTASVKTDYQTSGAYLTTAMASNRGSDFVQATAGFNGTNASGTIASNSVSISVAAPIPIATAVKGVSSVGSTGTITRYAPEDHQHAGVFSAGVSTVGNTAGNTAVGVGQFVFAASNSLTLSQATAANGLNTIHLQVGAYLTTADLSANSSKYVQNWKLTGNTTGTTSSAQGTDLWLAGGNGVTVSGSSNTLSFSVATSYLASNASTNYVQANAVFNGTNASGTIASNAISISVAAPGAGGGVVLYDGANSITSGTARFTNANGVSFTFNGQSISGSVSAIKGFGASNTGNTAGDTGMVAGVDWVLAGTNAVTVSQSTAVGGPNTLWLSAGNTASTFKAGGTNSGNTAGTTGSVDQSCVFVASRNITLSQSNDAANHSATITLLGAPLYTNSLFEPVQWDNAAISSSSSMVINSLVLQPFVLNNYLSINQCNFIGSIDFIANTFDGSGNTFTVSVGGASSFGFTYSASMTNANYINVYLFTKGSGNNTDALFTFASTQASFLSCYSVAMNLSATGGAASWSASAKSSLSIQVSYPAMTSGQAVNGASSWTTWAPGYLTNSSSTTASTSLATSTSVAAGSSLSVGSAYPANISSFFRSYKLIPVPFATSLTPGEYWLGVLRSTGSTFNSASANNNVGANNSYTTSINASSGATRTHLIAYAGSTATIVSSLGWFGAASNASMAPSPGHGVFTVATYSPAVTYINAAGQPNGAIALSQILSQTSQFRSWFQLANNRI